MTDPWIIPSHKFVTKEAKAKQDAKNAVAAAKALSDQQYVAPKPKSGGLFSSALGKLGDIAGAVVDAPVVGDVLHGANVGLQTLNNVTQSVPASLFTKGVVKDGQYETRRNLISNPIANIQSHVKAQREAGLIDPTENPLLAGVKAQMRTGETFTANPDISPGVRFASQVAFDPTTYIGAGAISKVAKIGALAGAKGKLARGAVGLAEGFESPKQIGKFIVGGAVGSELGAKATESTGIPGLELAGGMAGGLGGAMTTAKGVRRLGGLPGLTTEVAGTGELFQHGTPHIIPKGEIMISSGGDIHAGMYAERGASMRSAYEAGDNLEAYGRTAEDIGKGKELADQQGSRILHLQAKKDLLFLNAMEPVTVDELARIRNAVPATNRAAFNTQVKTNEMGISLSEKLGKILGSKVATTNVLADAGFDGMTNGGSQYTIFRPNEVFAHTKTIEVPPRSYEGIIQQYTVAQLDEAIQNPSLLPHLPQDDIKAALKWKKANPEFDPTNEAGLTKLHPGASLSPEEQKQAEIDSLLPEQRAKYNQLKAEQSWTPHSHLLAQATGEVPTQAPGWDPSKSPAAEWNTPLEPNTPSLTKPGIGNILGTPAVAPSASTFDQVPYVHDGPTPIATPFHNNPILQTIEDIHSNLTELSNNVPPSAIHAISAFLDEPIPTVAQSYKLAVYLEQYKSDPNIHEIILQLDEYGMPGKHTEIPKADAGVGAQGSAAKTYPTEQELKAAYTDYVANNFSGTFSSESLDAWYSSPEFEALASGTKSIPVNPVTPESIVGSPQQGTEAWINKITSENPTYQTHVSAAPGETPNTPPPGWGAPSPNSAAMQAKVDEIMAKYPTLDPVTVAKQVKMDALENLGGGSSVATLVSPVEPKLGLTGSEKVGNQFTKIKKFLINHGVQDNAVATPWAREYLRINSVVKNQATVLGKLAQRAEQTIPMNADRTEFIKVGLNPDQRELLKALESQTDSFDLTLHQFESTFPELKKYIADKRAISGNESKKFSDIITEYGNAIANKVADRWLGDKVLTVDELNKAYPNASTGQTRRLNLARASKVDLPVEVADVLGKAIKKVHPTQSNDFTQMFSAVNNTLRGLWATGDGSFIGIQQLPTWADNPKLAGQIMLHSLETLKDPTAFAKYIIAHDNAVEGSLKPTIANWVEHNLAIVSDTGAGTDIGGLPGRVKKIPVVGGLITKADRLFSESGNFNRVALADYLYDNWKSGGLPLISDLHVPKGADEAAVMRSIADAANRATGYANKGIGGSTGSALFFAPRFMQSQFEMITRAVSDGGLEGKIARRQLVKLAALGSSITIAANAARGKTTVYDPRDSNFMRIRDVAGADLSVFGPWDSLVRGIIRGLPQIDSEGDVAFGDPTYLLRSKLSPVLSTAVDFLTGENVLGQKVALEMPTNVGAVKSDVKFAKNMTLPFSLRGIGTEPASATAAGFFGIKGAPLTGSEKLDKTLSNAGIEKSDPEYLIKKRDYLAANPGDIPNASSAEFRKTQAVQQDITSRRSANDTATLNNEQTLVQFRSNRKTLLREQRDKLSVLISSGKASGNTKQSNWLKSYFDLFSQNIDPVTHDIDATTLDVKIADWTNTNGKSAADFVDKYLGAGLTPVEKAYHEDLAKLDAAGYFSMPRYTHMKSGLTDNQIDDYMAQVQAVRITDPKLQAQPVASTVRLVLGDMLTSEQIRDISNSTKTAYQNPAVAKFRASHRKELLWFNPKADWSSYNSVVNGAIPRHGSSNLTPISGIKLKSMLG